MATPQLDVQFGRRLIASWIAPIARAVHCTRCPVRGGHNAVACAPDGAPSSIELSARPQGGCRVLYHRRPRPDRRAKRGPGSEQGSREPAAGRRSQKQERINHATASLVCRSVDSHNRERQPGTLDSFDTFFRREQPKLFAVALAFSGDRELARDLTQEALLRAFRSWSHVERLERPGAWARRVLINLAVDTGRRRTAEKSALTRLKGRARAPLIASQGGSAEPFWAAVRELPTRQQTAVVLHYVDDLALADIADIMGIAVGTVKASLAHARSALARYACEVRDEERKS